MPTAAELALQKKYAELRAKKQKVFHKGLLAETHLIIFKTQHHSASQAADVKAAPAHTPLTRQSDGHIKGAAG